jgi:hypothetical protein
MSPITQKYLANFYRWREHRQLKQSFQRRPDALAFDSTSLTTWWLSHDQRCELRKETIQWSDVSEIWVYKKDCFTYDQIRMIFQTNHCIVEISEDMSGWQGLMDQVHVRLPGSTA